MASNFSAMSLVILFLSFTTLCRTSSAWIPGMGRKQLSEENAVLYTASSSQHNNDRTKPTMTDGVFQAMADGLGSYPGYPPQYPYPSGYYPSYAIPNYPNDGFFPYPQPTPTYPDGGFGNPGSFGSGFGSAGPNGGTGAGNGGASGGAFGRAPGANAGFGTGSANSAGNFGPGSSASGNGAGAGIQIGNPQVRPACPGCV